MSKKLFIRVVPALAVASAMSLAMLAGCSVQDGADGSAPGEVIEETIVENVPGTGSEDATKVMSEDEAKDIVFKDAGVAVDEATNVKVEKKTEDGVEVYGISFDAKGVSYDYVINAKTGALIEFNEEAVVELSDKEAK